MAFYILDSSLCTHHRIGCLMYIIGQLDCDYKTHEQLMGFFVFSFFLDLFAPDSWIVISQSMSSWWVFHLQFLFRCLCILCKVFFQYLSHLSYMWIVFWSSYSCYSMECSSWVVHKNQHHVISLSVTKLAILACEMCCGRFDVALHICPATYIMRIATLCSWQLKTHWSARHVSLKPAPLLHTGMLQVMAACGSPTSEAKDTIL